MGMWDNTNSILFAVGNVYHDYYVISG